MKDKQKYGVIGGLGGLMNGLFGSGGGLFLVPLLTGWAGMEQKKSFATSVAVILPLSLVSAAVYFWKGALNFSEDLSAALPYLIGGAAGGLISGKVFQKIPLPFLRRAFGLLILYGGVRAVLAL